MNITKTPLTYQLRQNIIECRQSRGWNQSEAAREIGVDKQTVNNWENGYGRTITEGNMHKLARAYQTTPEKLMKPKERKIIPEETKDSLGNALDQLVTNWPSIKEESE